MMFHSYSRQPNPYIVEELIVIKGTYSEALNSFVFIFYFFFQIGVIKLFAGEIPHELGNLSGLEFLQLFDNFLTDIIPSSIYKLLFSIKFGIVI